MFDLPALAYAFPLIVRGLLATIEYCLAGTICGVALGLAVAIARLSGVAPLQIAAAVFVELFRNTPFLVQAFLVYFGLSQLGLRLSAPVAGMLILSLFGAAQFSEIIRGAILSVPGGQLESARALGIPYLVALRRIVVPQSAGYLLPNMTNQIIGLIKDSASLSVIAVPEMATAAQTAVGETFSPVAIYAMVALVYWMLTGLVAQSLLRLTPRILPGGGAAASGRAPGPGLAFVGSSHE